MSHDAGEVRHLTGDGAVGDSLPPSRTYSPTGQLIVAPAPDLPAAAR